MEPICVLSALSWFLGLLRFDVEDAALTAADAGVTVIATDVLTIGSGVSGVGVVVGAAEGFGGLGVPF